MIIYSYSAQANNRGEAKGKLTADFFLKCARLAQGKATADVRNQVHAAVHAVLGSTF